MRTVAVNAANAGTQMAQSLSALQTQLDDDISSITTLATDTTFNSQPLLDGSLDDDQVAPGSSTVVAGMTQDATELPGGIALGSTLTATAAAPLTLAHSTVAVTLAGASSPLPGTTLVQGLSQNGTALTATAGSTCTVAGPPGQPGLHPLPHHHHQRRGRGHQRLHRHHQRSPPTIPRAARSPSRAPATARARSASPART